MSNSNQMNQDTNTNQNDLPKGKHTFKIGHVKGYEDFNFATGMIEVILVDERDNTLAKLELTLEALTLVVDFLDRNRVMGSLKDLAKSK